MVKRYARPLLGVSLCVSTLCAYAADDDTRFYHNQFGSYVSLSNTTVDDDQGTVSRSTELSRMGLSFYYPMTRVSKLESGMFYHNDSYGAGNNELGQKVKGFGLYGAYHHQVVMGRALRPWFGIGATYNSLSYEDRYKEDGDGFLLDEYPDRDEQEVALLLSANLVTDLSRQWDMLYQLHYESPLDTGVEGLFFSIGLLMK